MKKLTVDSATRRVYCQNDISRAIMKQDILSIKVAVLEAISITEEYYVLKFAGDTFKDMILYAIEEAEGEEKIREKF